ncbi:DUF1295 domain-containing protein [Aurantiacibacter sediminis]|uniref:DUF1295 domain-containing protein n=1 Tax=Aurantiacibacter sediminis TaxID=2793064 RepID=A0ABS0MZM2_9SPHN|nr:DUF1295 domain-containing protein [Aurantiacibacter sediminis]MBH5321157.1 DUF1295 domain-containing protein [Aurantiacibacter sediminis]
MAELIPNALALLAAMAVLWVISIGLGKVSFVDSVWGFSMATLAALSLWRADEPGTVAFLLCGMTVLWGVRLGIHLLRRFLGGGEDSRYRKILPDPDNRVKYALTALWKVWLLQAVLIMLVSSPAQLGILRAGAEASIGLLMIAGLMLYLVGLFFEWVGDWQLARFKADPANDGEVMNQGLWRYTRHPNYFGDACVWWGIWLVVAGVDFTTALWTVAGPVFLTFTLVKWSGAAMTEDGMRDKYGDEFKRYVERTSAFIPMPPSKGS